MIRITAPDPLALPAFILSIGGLCVATIVAVTRIASLVWHLVTRMRGAHRVKVRAIRGVMLIGAGINDGPFIEAEITNSGATACRSLSGRSTYGRNGDGRRCARVVADQPSVPYMLEAGTRVFFYARAGSIADTLKGRDISAAKIYVHLATGQIVRSARGQLMLDELALGRTEPATAKKLAPSRQAKPAPNLNCTRIRPACQ